MITLNASPAPFCASCGNRNETQALDPGFSAVPTNLCNSCLIEVARVIITQVGHPIPLTEVAA